MATFNSKTSAPAEIQLRSRLIPVSDWPKHHPWPPIGGLRHLVFHAEHNGIGKALRRVGRRVLIDEAAFFQWVEESSRG